MTVLAARFGLTGAFAALALALVPGKAQARIVHWQHAGASVFGGACEPGEHTGYRGDYLPTRWRSFAELGMGTALGGLAYNQQIRVLWPATHRRMTIRRRDIGLGGGAVAGLRRAIDLYEPVLTYLLRGRSCTWTGVLLYRRLP